MWGFLFRGPILVYKLLSPGCSSRRLQATFGELCCLAGLVRMFYTSVSHNVGGGGVVHRPSPMTGSPVKVYRDGCHMWCRK